MTAAELAARWHVPEWKAEEWLRAFEAAGFAERRGDRWYATHKGRHVWGLEETTS